ncbi:MAG TPA: efflux transporter outer membrane subunit [Steroidobacteraceae bacterium]|nr:efflux transporter outer membrane subunit [Steroidobacteraceae bacterium]
MSSYRFMLAASVAAVLAGCAVGPNYREPHIATADQWHSLPPQGVRDEGTDAPSLAAWWTVLADDQLTSLIDRAVQGSTTVQQAIARVKEARARRGVAIAPLFPSIGASAGMNRVTGDTRQSGSTFGLQDADIYSAGLDASWELDLFGGRRRSIESATAQLAASEADLRDALVTLVGDVALNYVSVRTSQSRLTFAERNLDAQREVLDITRWRSEAGLATSLDVEQANSSYQQTLAQIPSLESTLAAAMNRLAVLIGEQPGALNAELSERKAIPPAPVDIVVGAPADLLRRRPDIRAAERRLAAQTAAVGVAISELYPSLSLTGSIGYQSPDSGDVLNGPRTNRFGVSLNLPIFRGGALVQSVRAQRAVVDEARASYEGTVLAAFEEVENDLTAWANEQRRHDSLTQAVDSARRAADLALQEYNSGLVDFQVVLTADRQLIALEDSLAVSDGERTGNLVRLYKALGGGWSVFPTAEQAAATR